MSLAWRPEFIDAPGSGDQPVDTFAAQAEELFRVAHPQIPKGSPDYREQLAAFLQNYDEGRWVRLPWLGAAVKILKQRDFERVLVSRNQGLISAGEQDRLGGAKVGIAGLSVGSQVLKAVRLSGPIGLLRLADPDTLDLSNLNRLDGTVTDLGLPKVIRAAREVYGANPYANVEIFEEGVTAENVDDFVKGLDVVVCAMDHLPMKVRLRQAAARHGVAVVMATDAENVLLDVEPHHEKTWEPFHGGIGAEDVEAILQAAPEDRAVFIKGAMRIIGLDGLTAELMKALPEVGRNLVSQPQLGSSAMASGAVAGRAIVRLLTGRPIKEGRTNLGIEAAIDPDWVKGAAERKELARLLASQLGLTEDTAS